ncbi:MAG: hypothetical protein ACREM8_12570, partial [Vulcanimicrobiaceae bacterium]
TNVVDTDDGDPEKVDVHAFDGAFRTTIDKPEEPGAFSFPPIASLITAGARLMLGMVERCVTDLGGTYAMEDTDSMAIVANERGGFVPCPNGPHPWSRKDALEYDGPVTPESVTAGKRAPKPRRVTRALHALSWAQVDAIVGRFAALNPYDRTIVPGSILKIEDVNFADIARRDRVQLYCYAISAKRYTLFTLDERNEPCVRRFTLNEHGEPIYRSQYSEHGLGHLLNPTDPDSEDRAWIAQSWTMIVREAMGLPVEEPAWLDRPAMARISVSTPTVHATFATMNDGRDYADSVKPFNFLIAPQVAAFGTPAGVDPAKFRLVAPFSPDPKQWMKMRWHNVHDGKPYAIAVNGSASHALFAAPVAKVETYRDVLANFPWHPEAKKATATGETCGNAYAGPLYRRNVRIAQVDYLGKEANAIEDPVLGALSGTITDEDEIERRYVNPGVDRLAPLRTV